jgi:hypothetical protein
MMVKSISTLLAFSHYEFDRNKDYFKRSCYILANGHISVPLVLYFAWRSKLSCNVMA